jgi:hypothetical protein
VPARFITPVPIRVELASGDTAMMTAVVVKEEQTFEFNLPSRPKRVDFNADYGVLAKVSKM